MNDNNAMMIQVRSTVHNILSVSLKYWAQITYWNIIMSEILFKRLFLFLAFILNNIYFTNSQYTESCLKQRPKSRPAGDLAASWLGVRPSNSPLSLGNRRGPRTNKMLTGATRVPLASHSVQQFKQSAPAWQPYRQTERQTDHDNIRHNIADAVIDAA